MIMHLNRRIKNQINRKKYFPNIFHCLWFIWENEGCPQYPSKNGDNSRFTREKIIGNVLTESSCDGNETVTEIREIPVIIHHLSTCYFIWEFPHNSIHADLCEKHHSSVICVVSMQSFVSPRLLRYRVYINDRERSVLSCRGVL